MQGRPAATRGSPGGTTDRRAAKAWASIRADPDLELGRLQTRDHFPNRFRIRNFFRHNFSWPMPTAPGHLWRAVMIIGMPRRQGSPSPVNHFHFNPSNGVNLNFIKFPVFLAVLGLLAACAGTAPPSPSSTALASTNQPAQQLAALAETYLNDSFALNPLQATRTGEERYFGMFVNNLTPAYRDSERKLQLKTLAALKQIDAQSLTDADRITRAVLEYRATMRLEELQFDFNLTPINQFYSLPVSLVELASTEGAQPFRTVRHYELFLERLAGFPDWVDSAIANMRTGMDQQVVLPKVLIQKMLPQLKSQVVADPTRSGFYVPVTKFPASFSDADKARLTAAYRKMVEEKITPAFVRFHGFVEKEYLPRGRETAGLGGMPGGAAKYAYLVRQVTTTTLAPEEIHQIGLREVARIRGEMDKVRQRVGFQGDLPAFIASIATNKSLMPFKTEAEILEAYRTIQKKVEPQLTKAFSRTPRSALVIRGEPEITKATAAAHYSTGTADGSRPGVFYAPVRDAATYTTPQMTSLFLHEGVPGHHFQLSLAIESSLPRFRRYTSFTAYSEGWGLYAESLGSELGVYDDPYQYLGRLLAEMHRAIRLVVDTGMHAKGWTREQAIDYAVENEGGLPSQAVPEIERYMAIPGQALAYKIGELKILELRHRAERQLGTRFDLRAFHDAVLNDGGLPLSVLEEKLNRWMAAR
jgi:uncharacterized protein (DUF885 family)